MHYTWTIYFLVPFVAAAQVNKNSLKDDCVASHTGDPLFLTPYIRNADFKTARQLAKVNSSREHLFDVVSYSGYLTVNETLGSNLFFWFFPSKNAAELFDSFDDAGTDQTKLLLNETPLLLWLQGGPGISSLMGVFLENGPFSIVDYREIKENPHSWHTKYSVLYIDSPIGSGYSFTNDAANYPSDTASVAVDVLDALQQFYSMFSWLRLNDLYITGQSYAGKYIPVLGNLILNSNRQSTFDIPLKGVAMGNAVIDMQKMVEYADFAYQTGLIDIHGHKRLQMMQNKMASLSNDSNAANEQRRLILDTLSELSSYDFLYSILDPNTPAHFFTFSVFATQCHIRKALHVGMNKFSVLNRMIFDKLQVDFMRPITNYTEQLLDAGLRVMYYSGNLDLTIPYPTSENMYRQFQWNGTEKYLSALRTPLMIDKILKGYVKRADNFIDVVVLNAGHMVPTDQPAVALELIDRFVNDKL